MNNTDNHTDVDALDDTTQINAIDEFAPVSESEQQWSRRKPRFKATEIIEYEDGSKAVVFRTLKTTRRGDHAWARRLFYRLESKTMELEESNFVELSLVSLLDLDPVPGEDRIHHLRRRSWWEHGPWQLTIVVGFLVCVVIAISTTVLMELPADFGFWFIVLAGLFASVAYYVVWMQWAYEYLLITNKRLGLIYRPPFGLVGKGPMAFLNKLTLNEANDQSWFANIIGKRNPAYLYGVLNLDTNAQKDEWMNAVKFVREHKAVRELIARLTAEAEMYEVRETDEQLESRQLQDMANRRFLEINGQPD